MLSKRVALTCLLISGVIFLAAAARAWPQTLASARILSSDGPVEIQRRAQGQAALSKVTYRVNDEVLAGDVIKTGRGGRLVLGLADGSQAIIGENTTVEVTDLSKSPRTIFNVMRGKTRIKIEKVGGRPNPYRVNTPTAVIAVRGTLFDVFVKERETSVFVHEGEVSVSNLTLPDAPVILLPGMRTRVEPTRAPEPPARFQPGRNNETFIPRPPERQASRGEPDNQRGENDPGQRQIPGGGTGRQVSTQPPVGGGSPGPGGGQRGGERRP
jgi:hypothetical protein